MLLIIVFFALVTMTKKQDNPIQDKKSGKYRALHNHVWVLETLSQLQTPTFICQYQLKMVKQTFQESPLRTP